MQYNNTFVTQVSTIGEEYGKMSFCLRDPKRLAEPAQGHVEKVERVNKTLVQPVVDLGAHDL